MPYKFESLKIKMPRDKDKRIKLSDEDRREIKYLYFQNKLFIREIARLFSKKCCRRNIQFILFPERIINNRRYRNWRNYYNKTKHAKNMKKHRRYKQKILTNLPQISQ